MRSFAFVPYENEGQLARTALTSLDQDLFDQYILVNNSGAPLSADITNGTSFEVWDLGRRLTFRETQNLMRSYAMALDFDVYFFMHSDAAVRNHTDRALLSFVQELNDSWGAVFTNYDALAAYSVDAVRQVGTWGDPFWPSEQHSGYFLDIDYYRRMELEGFKLHTLPESNVTHVESASLREATEAEHWEAVKARVIQHYRQKWGGEPRAETVTDVDQALARLP